MAQKNRELQRLPPHAAQRSALRNRMGTGRLRTVVSDDPLYGLLRVQIELLLEADELAPKMRGPKPKRQTLLRILDILESYCQKLVTA